MSSPLIREVQNICIYECTSKIQQQTRTFLVFFLYKRYLVVKVQAKIFENRTDFFIKCSFSLLKNNNFELQYCELSRLLFLQRSIFVDNTVMGYCRCPHCPSSSIYSLKLYCRCPHPAEKDAWKVCLHFDKTNLSLN